MGFYVVHLGDPVDCFYIVGPFPQFRGPSQTSISLIHIPQIDHPQSLSLSLRAEMVPFLQRTFAVIFLSYKASYDTKSGAQPRPVAPSRLRRTMTSLPSFSLPFDRQSIEMSVTLTAKKKASLQGCVGLGASTRPRGECRSKEGAPKSIIGFN